jgi:hypothetical protein
MSVQTESGKAFEKCVRGGMKDSESDSAHWYLLLALIQFPDRNPSHRPLSDKLC